MAVQNATIVAVVGAGSSEVVSALGHLRGVDALQLGEPSRSGTERISASNAPYVVHDADPLGHVAHAWVEFFDDRSTAGALELEINTALDAFAAGERVMPDYYVVLDPESWDGTWRHWWFGALAERGKTRVVPQPPAKGAGSRGTGLPSTGDAASMTGAAAWSVRQLLRRLPTGPGWVAPAKWLPELTFAVPDRWSVGGVTP